MTYNSDELRKVQAIALDIFKKIIKVCEENNIEYFIIGGTLLGAVRHKGFIPWDDDLDIGMTRENYNKFLKIAEMDLPNDLFLQTFHTEPDSPFYFAKVRKNGTKFVEDYCKELNIHHGIFVDIFPFDNIPDDIKLKKTQLKKVRFWVELFIAKSVRGSSTRLDSLSEKLKITIRAMLHILLKPVSKNYLFKKLDAASQQYNNVPCRMKSFVKNPCLTIPSVDLDNLVTVEFEGITVKCPGNPESYLKYQFGDFMTLPPEDKRVGHKPYKLEV